MSDTFTSTRTRRAASPARWLTVALLSIIAAALLIEAGLATSTARAQVGAAGRTKGIVAVPGKITSDIQGVYLVDLDNGTICVYGYMSGSGVKRLRLLAARTFIYDVQLDEFNTEPLPRKIKDLVEQQKRLGSTPPGQ